MSDNEVEKYLKMPYTIEIIRETDPASAGWVARVLELPGCITQGDTFEELEEMIADAMRGWISVALEDGLEIPLPRMEEDYSGKFVVRVPKSLHRRLVIEAEREGVSLNQFINVVLAGEVGLTAKERSPQPQSSPQEMRAWLVEALQEALRQTSINNIKM